MTSSLRTLMPLPRDGAHGEFWLVWDTGLAHHDHVERRAERSGYLEGDGNAAAGKPEHDHVAAAKSV